MMPLTGVLLNSFAVVMTIMVVLWCVSLAVRNASIVDPYWGTGFVLVAWLTFLSLTDANESTRSWLLVLLTTIWGVRLTLYLCWRNLGHGEDRRYRAMREHHGARFWWVSLLTVFWLQGVILWFVSIPIQAGLFVGQRTLEPRTLGWLDLAGASLWLIGFVFESVGDFQMARFQRDPANTGRVMDRGLWRYSRHPNYFGDFCVWWGLYLIAAAGGAGWTIFSPLLMSFLLLKVSGVSLLERTIASRRPDYAEYQRQTNAFFPGPNRVKLPTEGQQ